MKKVSCFVIAFIITIITSNIAKAQTKTLSKNEKLQWWREAKFGMFIHWGVYAQWAGRYNNHEQAKGGAEWLMNRMKVPVAEYREKAKSFNPTKYNADEWVKMAKAAGMKYIVITAKHHDGFALFKSKASNWNIVDATAYKKDALQALAAACKKHGMKLGFYYSQAQDWVNPGGTVAQKNMYEGWPNPDSAAIDAYTKAHKGKWDAIQESKTFEEYIDGVAVPQVKELLTNYGDIAILWWDTPVQMTDEAAYKFQAILNQYPKIITNDRLKRPNFPGDTKSPEQYIPTQEQLDSLDWETNMTMNGTWGFRTLDTNWKSTTTLIHNLCDIASKGGNYLLNIGPKDDGSFPQASIDRLKEISLWMNIYGESIYNTKRTPFLPFTWGRCTRKEIDGNTTLYLQVFNWPTNGQLVIPSINNEVIAATLLHNQQAVSYTKQNGNLVIQLPTKAPNSIASVIKINVQGLIADAYKTKGKMKTGELD